MGGVSFLGNLATGHFLAKIFFEGDSSGETAFNNYCSFEMKIIRKFYLFFFN